MRHDSSSPFQRRSSKSFKKHAKKKMLQRRLTRALRLEHLEERTVMDSSLYYESPYTSNGTLRAVGENATWSADAGMQTTSSQVIISPVGIVAPDGGRDASVTNSNDTFRQNFFYPKNGLISIESGQNPITNYGTQQEINLQPLDVFSPQSLLKFNYPWPELQDSALRVTTTLTVSTTGQYTFYLTSLNAYSIKINNASAESARYKDARLTVNLVAGTEYSMELNYDAKRGDYVSHETTLDLEGPNLPRQKFSPSGDVVWKASSDTASLNSNPRRTGFYAISSMINAEKRLRDDNYNLRYKTSVTIPTTGEYSFFLNSDNTGSLKLGSDVVINKASLAEATGKRTLTAGTVIEVEINYKHATGARQLKLEWSGPNMTRQTFTPTNELQYEYYLLDAGNNVTQSRKGTTFNNSDRFAIEFDGQRTPVLQRGATAEQVEKALNALSTIGDKGGNVKVSRSADGSKYNVTFGGSLWHRPRLMTLTGSELYRVTPVTAVALTKRTEGYPLKIGNLARSLTVPIKDGNTFAIEDAPYFTPEVLYSEEAGSNLRMKGYLQVNGIGGRFDYSEPWGGNDFNVERTASGLTLIRSARSYKLNAIQDPSGNSRPITFFSQGGLTFEVPEGIPVSLNILAGNTVQFESAVNEITASAPYEGGRLNVKLTTRNASASLFTIDVQTGKTVLNADMTFVSLELGGITTPASDALKMTYDAATDRYSFAIKNLTLATSIPTVPSLGKVNDAYKSIVQTFDSYLLGPITMKYRVGWPGEIANFDTITDLTTENADSLTFPTPREAYINSNYRPYIARYYSTLTVPTTGTYTFSVTEDKGEQQLKIGDNFVFRGKNQSGTVQLVAGMKYTFELTLANQGRSTRQINLMYMQGPGFDEVRLQRPQDYGYYFEDTNLSISNLSVDSVRASLNRVSYYATGGNATLADQADIRIDGNKVTVTNFPILAKMQGAVNRYEGALSNPIKMVIPSGTLTITKGVLEPILDLPLDSFEIGRTAVTTDRALSTTFEPVKPSSAGGFKLTYIARNTYFKDGSVNVPGNSFGIYGNQTQLPLEVAGVKLSGIANLGTADAPGMIATNGQFYRLSYNIPNVQVDNLTFTATDVGSALPLSVNYYPPQGSNRKSYVVLGGAALKPGGTVVKSDMKANLGGLGSDGLRIFPATDSAPASFTFSYGVADTILAGTQAIQSAPGNNGLRLVYDPATKAYNFRGNGYLDLNPTRNHTPTDLEFTGTKLEISATQPVGVTNFPTNRIDGNSLTFFLGQDAAINGFAISPQASANPLRVTITNSNGVPNETIGGTFTMRIDGSLISGVMDPSSFLNAKVPATGLQLDFSTAATASFFLAGIGMDSAKKSTLTDTLSLQFGRAIFDGNVIAQGTANTNAAVVEARDGKVTKAEVRSTTAQTIGDFAFQNFVATYITSSAQRSWNFTGPATWFGKQVEVGKPAAGNPQLRIGSGATKGFELQTLSKPAVQITPDFKLPETIEIAGVTFDTTKMTQDAPPENNGSNGKTFTISSRDYAFKVGNTTINVNVAMKVGVSAAGVSIKSFVATAVTDSAFTIGNAKVQVKSLSVEYEPQENSLSITGTAKFSFKAGGANVQMDVSLGDKKEPGLVIKNGSVESFKVSVSGSFQMLKLTLKTDKLTVEYSKENREYKIFGSVKLSTAEQGGVQVIKDLSVSLGTDKKPGIRIVDGSLEDLNIALSGEINLFKVTAKAEKLRVQYSSAKNLLQITGSLSVTLAANLTITASLPNGGLLINTDTGKVQIKGLELKAEGELTFGVMIMKGLQVEYSEDDDGKVSVGAAAEILLPSGWAVGASFKIIDGKLDSIGISFEKNPGILLANGLVNIYRIEASVEGLTDLENFKITGTVKATVGPLVKFGGESYALADVTGTIIVTPTDLTLKGKVKLVGGKFGTGNFEGKLIWTDTARVKFEANVNLYPGDVVRGTIKAYADIKGNVDFKADMGVFVPGGIPLVGGASLGQLKCELRIRPAEEPSASYVKFEFSDIAISAFRIPTFFGSVRIGFDKLVDYQFGARFYIPLPWPLPNIDYSLSFDGKFQLRDATENPFVEILAAGSLPGTPDGEIVFSSKTVLPSDTTIDLYADKDNTGNDGLLIASSIPYQADSQTFVWKDMASFARPGDPIYVYAVINDGKHAKGYSSYSPKFNAAPGFVPTLSNPSVVHFPAGNTVVFSAANSNAIVVDDKRLATNPNSEVEVVLTVGGGTLDLSRVATNVRYSGVATGRLTLRGSASDINTALDGLIYIQNFASSVPDKLNITVNNLPLNNPNAGTTATIQLDPNPLVVSMLPSAGAAPTTISLNESHQNPLADVGISSLTSSHIISAKVTIGGYEKGQDVLTLPFVSEVATDVQSDFDEESGVLTLTGFEWIEDYQLALQSIEFTTKSLTSGKSLTIALSDDNGDDATFSVPLTIVAGHADPELSLNVDGAFYVVGDGNLTILPEANLSIADNAKIQKVTFEFVDGSFVAGADRLNYAGSAVTANFNPTTGTLTLTGSASVAQWNAAINAVTFASGGLSFTEGNRYIHITVQDDSGTDHSLGTALLVVNVASASSTHSGPVLTLGTSSLNLGANDAFAYLAPDLALSASSPMLVGASVTISANYVQGEDELAVNRLWDGMDAEFDALTGILTITGLATVFEYEDVLRSVIFVDSAGFRTPGPAEITYRVNDGLSPSEIQVMTIEIASAPYVEHDLDRELVYTTGKTTSPIDSSIKIQSVGNLSGALVWISGGFAVGEDVLNFTNQSGITGRYDSATGILTLTGTATASAYEAALESIQYQNTRFNPSAGERIVSYQVLNGTALSNVSDALISVEPDIVPPQVDVGSGTSYTEDGSPVLIAPNFNLTARDATTTELSAPEELYGAEIRLVDYIRGEDILSLSRFHPNIAGDFDATEGRIFLTGQATFEEYEAAIRTIIYSNLSEAPSTTPRKISIRLLDSGANGLNNQAFVTQVVVGLPDPVTLVSGSIDNLTLLQNEHEVRLGLDDLNFSSQDLAQGHSELIFKATQLPTELLGRIVKSDGAAIELNKPYKIAELAGLKFVPEVGGLGTQVFKFIIALSDINTGNIDSASLTETIQIKLDGIATSTESEALVAQMVRDLLNQNPDAATLATLSAQFNAKLKLAGRESSGLHDDVAARSSFVKDYMQSDAYLNKRLTSTMQALLNRVSSTTELSNLRTQLKNGLEFDDLLILLASSDEYLQSHNASGWGGFVTSVYRDLLGRTPTESELNTKVNNLLNGKDRGDVVESIGAWGNVSESDRQAIVIDLLHRLSKFDDDVVYDFSSRSNLIVSLIGSDEYYARSSSPTNTTRVLTQTTADYPSVGKVGDILGDRAGGTLIASQFVLVAAHSVNDIPPGQLTFTIGGIKHSILNVYLHPNYNSDAAGTDDANDIAILKLDQPITNITPSTLAGRGPKLGEFLTLVGFGEEDGTAYGTKRMGSTPNVATVYSRSFQWMRTSAVQNDSDAGDSGSPLFANVNGVSQIVGIVSGGVGGSSLGSVSTNTRVDSYLSWIKSIVPTIQTTDTIDPTSLYLSDSELFLDENAGVQKVPFSFAAAGSTSFYADSDAPDLFREIRVQYDQTGNGLLIFTTADNKRGTGRIVLRANTGSQTASTTLTVTAEERNDPPTMDVPAFQVIDQSAATKTIPLSGISAGKGETGKLQIQIKSVSPSNLILSSGIAYTQGASDATVHFTTPENASGNGVFNLEVRDAGPDNVLGNADDGITQVFAPFALNNAPTINALSNMRVLKSTGEQTVALSGIASGEIPAQALILGATSSNPSVVANPTIVYDPNTSKSAGQLKFTPLATGTTIISVLVRDAGPDGRVLTEDDAITTRTFTVEVVAALNPWQNPTNPLDVNDDHSVSPLDVLILINAINAGQLTVLPSRNEVVPPFYDVNNNGSLDPLDALMVINAINQDNRGAEGESDSVDTALATMAFENDAHPSLPWWSMSGWDADEFASVVQKRNKTKSKA